MTTPAFLILAGGAAVALGLVTFLAGVWEHRARGGSRWDRRFIAWGVLVFVVGVFLIAGGLMADDNPKQSRTLDDSIALEYERMATRVNREVADETRKLLGDGASRSVAFRRARAAELSVNIDRILSEFGRDVRSRVEESSTAARAHGLRVARRNIRGIGLESAARAAGQTASFAFLNERAVALAVRDSIARLGAGAIGHAANARKVFRDLSASAISGREPEINRAIVDGIALGKTGDAERAIRELFRGDGQSALSYRRLGAMQINVGRAVMSVRQYASTVMITRSAELAIDASRDAQLDVGLDLQQCVGTVTENFCTRSVGVVFVIGPARDGYPSVDELPNRGRPFHPRCRKSFRAVDPTVQPDVLAAHRRAVTPWKFAQRNGLLTTNLKTA